METLAQTQAGFVLGTLRYMSPEQARGQAVDHRSDIFSLGVVLYEMVTGQLPFSGKTALDTLHAIAFEETRPVTALRPNLPPSLQRVITRCLRKRAQDRYPDAKELVGDLKTVQREIESGVSSKAPLGAAAAGALAVAARSDARRVAAAGRRPGVALAVLVSVVAPCLGRRDHPRAAVLPASWRLLLWRRFRNRRLRLARRFVEKAAKMPEIRLVASTACASPSSPTAPRPGPTCGRTPCSTRSTRACSSATRSRSSIRDEFPPDEEKALALRHGRALRARDDPRAALPGTTSS